MRIVKLQAENLKRLRAVEIVPDGNTVLISGRNGQGKSSVLDAIWYALGGKDATKGIPRPIRDGAESARVVLDLGDFIVTREWTANDESALRITMADGTHPRTPQAMLDALVGRFSFDPLAFSRLKPREQVDALLSVVDVGFDPEKLAVERKELYDERHAVGRKMREAEAVVAKLPPLKPDVPETELPTGEVVAKLRAASEIAAKNAATRRELERFRGEASTQRERVNSGERKVSDLEAALVEARRMLAEERERLARMVDEGRLMKAKVDALADPDVTGLEGQLAEIERSNRAFRDAEHVRKCLAEAEAWREEYGTLTRRIDELDAHKAEALASAQFPAPGLSFGEECVTFRGIPLPQCASSEQLRVSLAVAMAANPTLRVIRIAEGNLLDGESLAVVEEMAREADYQVWIELVDDSGEVGVVIEDGGVKGAIVSAPMPTSVQAPAPAFAAVGNNELF